MFWAQVAGIMAGGTVVYLVVQHIVRRWFDLCRWCNGIGGTHSHTCPDRD